MWNSRQSQNRSAMCKRSANPRLGHRAMRDGVERDLNERRNDIGHQHLLGEADDEDPGPRTPPM